MADTRPVVSHKLVLLGDTSVGKSCLVVRFCRYCSWLSYRNCCTAIYSFKSWINDDTHSSVRHAPSFPSRQLGSRGEFFDYQEPTIGGECVTRHCVRTRSFKCGCVVRRSAWTQFACDVAQILLFGCAAAFLTQSVQLEDCIVRFEVSQRYTVVLPDVHPIFANTQYSGRELHVLVSFLLG